MQSGLPMRKESQWSEILITGMNQPMSWKEENHWGFIPVLYRMCRSMLYTNIVSRHIKGNIFTRQILLQIMQSFVRELPPELLISAIFPGRIRRGWSRERHGSIQNSLCRFMRSTSAHGKSILTMRTVFIITGNLRVRLRSMLRIWDIPILRLWALPSIPLTVPGDIR